MSYTSAIVKQILYHYHTVRQPALAVVVHHHPSWQIKSTTFFGGGTLALYLVMIVVSLGWRQQVGVGVGLAIGGAVVFACGIALSVYREKLLELPERIAKREGIFCVISWR